jgi:hypothetical protein
MLSFRNFLHKTIQRLGVCIVLMLHLLTEVIRWEPNFEEGDFDKFYLKNSPADEYVLSIAATVWS